VRRVRPRRGLPGRWAHRSMPPLDDEILCYLQPTSNDVSRLEQLGVTSLRMLFQAVQRTCRHETKTGMQHVTAAVPRGMLLLWLRDHLSDSSRLQVDEAVRDGVLISGGRRPREWIGYLESASRGDASGQSALPPPPLAPRPHSSAPSAARSYYPPPPPPAVHHHDQLSARDSQFLAELEGMGDGGARHRHQPYHHQGYAATHGATPPPPPPPQRPPPSGNPSHQPSAYPSPPPPSTAHFRHQHNHNQHHNADRDAAFLADLEGGAPSTYHRHGTADGAGTGSGGGSGGGMFRGGAHRSGAGSGAARGSEYNSSAHRGGIRGGGMQHLGSNSSATSGSLAHLYPVHGDSTYPPPTGALPPPPSSYGSVTHHRPDARHGGDEHLKRRRYTYS
jgi:hypothetical protein